MKKRRVRFYFDETSKIPGEFCFACALVSLWNNSADLQRRAERSRRVREDLALSDWPGPQTETPPEPCRKHPKPV